MPTATAKREPKPHDKCSRPTGTIPKCSHRRSHHREKVGCILCRCPSFIEDGS
jgi:hypothetical protein